MGKRPKIRHLAIVTLDPERLAKFYEQTFDMTRVKAERGVPGSKAVYMTDGYITLALLENKAEGKPSGLNHFGWHVDDQDEIAQRLTVWREGARQNVSRLAMPRPAAIPAAAISTSRLPLCRGPSKEKSPVTA